MTERNELISYISDAHKDAYGFRPRGDFSSMSIDQLRSYADDMSEAVAVAMSEEEIRLAKAEAHYESVIAETIEHGAGDRATAIRWLVQSEDVDGDAGFFCYMYGISYSHETEVNSAIN